MEALEYQPDELKEIAARCCASTKVHAKVLHPERFHRAFAKLTDQIFKALDDDKIQRVVIKAPRGWGKTSITNFAYLAKHVLFRTKRFIVPISNTATQAVMQSENLKIELRANTTIRKLFGDVKTNRATDDDIDTSFSKEAWVANGHTLVMPRGAGQQVRGIIYRNYRPDLIVCDDLEDAEGVRSEDQRKKLAEWFFADVCNSVDRGNKDWKIVFIGTLLHEDSLLAKLLKDPKWFVIEIDLCSDDLKSNWPDFMTDEDVQELYEEYKAKGQLDVFAREYRGVAIDKETASFQQKYFKYYSEVPAKPEVAEQWAKTKLRLENVVIIDPAKTTNFLSADSAIVGVGIDTQTSSIYVRDIVAGKLHPDEIYDQAFLMAERIGARVIGYEVTSLNEFITYPITTEMIRRKKFFHLVELKARGAKEDRIAMLVPFYRMGYIWHNAMVCPVLEQQLLNFPRSKRWDVMDALAYIVELLELGERYFTGTSVGDDEEKPEDIEAEFRELEMENEPAARGWRCC